MNQYESKQEATGIIPYFFSNRAPDSELEVWLAWVRQWKVVRFSDPALSLEFAWYRGPG